MLGICGCICVTLQVLGELLAVEVGDSFRLNCFLMIVYIVAEKLSCAFLGFFSSVFSVCRCLFIVNRFSLGFVKRCREICTLDWVGVTVCS